jgi:hypothetical protein
VDSVAQGEVMTENCGDPMSAVDFFSGYRMSATSVDIINFIILTSVAVRSTKSLSFLSFPLKCAFAVEEAFARCILTNDGFKNAARDCLSEAGLDRCGSVIKRAGLVEPAVSLFFGV